MFAPGISVPFQGWRFINKKKKEKSASYTPITHTVSEHYETSTDMFSKWGSTYFRMLFHAILGEFPADGRQGKMVPVLFCYYCLMFFIKSFIFSFCSSILCSGCSTSGVFDLRKYSPLKALRFLAGAQLQQSSVLRLVL